MIRLFSTLLLIGAIFTTTASEIKQNEAPTQDCAEPIAQISSKDGKYKISVSGNINLRASYDFNGSVTAHPDFIPSLIPVPGTFDSDHKFYMDATTSRIEVKGTAQTEKFGEVELCLNGDMRGGSIGSYTPRVRLAYIAVAGFMAGRNYTTFFDTGSLGPTIDFQGPNVCPAIYTTQIRYTHSLLEDRITLGAALEYHIYESSTLGDNFDYQQQYAPSIPAYVQFNLGKEHSSHIRLTGLYKNIPLYDNVNESNLNLNGWGTQLSGSIGCGSKFKIYYSGTCGEGISEYMQETYGLGLDVTVDADAQPKMTFMYGWQASGLLQITDRVMVSAGYSVVNIEGDESRFAADDYRQGEYLFGNVFYSITPRIQLAAEFLWGSRTNTNNARNTANRINTMVQYNF